MTDKIELNSALGTYDVTQINNNFDSVATELNEKVFYRDPPEGASNEMKSNLDMNSNRILNLPVPLSDNEPVRKIDMIPNGFMQSLKATATQLLSGNGTQTVFTLTNPPDTEENTQVYVSGIYQQKNTYTLSGSGITFSEAPPAGTNNIEVVSLGAIALELAVPSQLKGGDGSSLIGFQQDGVGANQQTVQDVLREHININAFLTTPGVITQADYDKAKTKALTVGGVLKIHGAYSFSALNLAAQDLIVECGPKTILNHTGAGVGLSIDGGTSSTGVFNFKLRGNPLIVGNVSTTDGVFVRALHHSDVEYRVKDVTTGSRINFAVCSKFKVTCSVNEGGFNRTPSAGIVTDIRDTGECVQDCEIYAIIEGVSGTGIDLHNTVGCEIKGTSEGNGKGIVESSTCSKNTFIRLDLESNTTSDVECSSESPTFDNCLALSASTGDNCQLITARGAKFIGGFWRTVNCQASSADTLFIGVATSDNGSLGIKGGSSYKTLNCVKQNTSGVTTVRIPDRIGDPSGTWTPGFASSGGGAQGTVSAAVGTYYRIGNLCFVQGFMSIAKGTLAAGAVSITGLPYQSRNTTNDYQYIHMAEWDNLSMGAGYSTLVMRIAPNSAVGTLLKSGSSVLSANVNVADFPDPMGMRFSGVYEVYSS